LGDALGEFLAGEDILEFGDERGAGEERLSRCSRAALRTSAGGPPQKNAETTVLVSATTRTVGPGGRDLGVDFRLGECGIQDGELAHGGEQLIDLVFPHRLAQQPLDGLRAQKSGGLSLLGQLIG
jgi:hypothetical protein